MEKYLHQQIADYLRLQYPPIVFHSDYGSGIKLTMGQASMQKRLSSSRGWPDIFVPEPRGGCAGLFIELKREGTVIHRQDGKLVANDHIKEQAAMLDALRARGFCAEFGIGFDQTRLLIDNYLSGKLAPKLHNFARVVEYSQDLSTMPKA